jgi:hypothetical protein
MSKLPEKGITKPSRERLLKNEQEKPGEKTKSAGLLLPSDEN